LKKLGFLLLLFCSYTLLFAAGVKEEKASEVIVFAAASTSDLMEDAGALFNEKTGITVKLNPASSGTLARQLEQGAFADIYISAAESWIEYAEELELLKEYTAMMSNSLVVIAPVNSEMKPFEITPDSDIPDFGGRLSIADPDHAPAGKYAIEAMQSCGWYPTLSDRILPGADVRKALSVVEFGEAELGVVYKTDADKSEKVKILAVFPKQSHQPIGYFCGLTDISTEAGSMFYSFITESPEMSALIRKYGFSEISR
jgi:molybdate transport system substrate-binding protein